MADNDAARIYEVIKHFNSKNWRTFARTKLRLSNSEVEECEENCKGDLREQRYQMVHQWQMNNGRIATVDRLEQLAGNCQQVTVQAPPAESESKPKLENLALSVRSGSNSERTTSAVTKYPSSPVGDMPEPSWQKNGKELSAGAFLHKNHESGSANAGSSGATATPVGGPSSASARKAFSNDSPGQKKKNTATKPVFEPEQASEVPLKPVIADGKKKKGIAQKAKELISIRKKKNSSPISKSLPASQGSLCAEVKKVKVTKSSAEVLQKIMQQKNCYELKKPKGCVLILNNSFESATDERNKRHGSDKDVKNMKNLWLQIGCELHKGGPQCEKTAEDMKKLLREMTQLKVQYGFIVIVIMTHGRQEGGNLVFTGVDNESVRVDEIEKMFSNENAKNLRNIPKFFIFQFCRGDKMDKGVECDAFDKDVEEVMKNFTRIKLSAPNSDAVEADGARLLPTTSDTLIAYATQPEYAALRSPVNGSWFINAITNVFMTHAHNEDVEDMLTRVNRAMKDMSAPYEKKNSKGDVVDSYPVKAMSKHETSFCKKLYLAPGYQ